MFKFLVGFIIGFYTGMFVGAKLGRASSVEHFTGYLLKCEYEDKTVDIQLKMANFPPEKDNILMYQKIFRGTCNAFKAFEKCPYLKQLWPKERKKGVKFFSKNPITLQYQVDNPEICAWVSPLEPDKIYLVDTLFTTRGCGQVDQIIFHEILHHAGLPNHSDHIPRHMDEIEKAVYMCIPNTEGFDATFDRKRCNVNE